jgi:hypothetical protein
MLLKKKNIDVRSYLDSSALARHASPPALAMTFARLRGRHLWSKYLGASRTCANEQYRRL